MNSKTVLGWISGAVVIFVVVIAGSAATYVVDPGYRGVEVMLGKVSPGFKPEGFGFKLPFITNVEPQLIRQQTAKMQADCYSSDLQQVKIDVRVLYRVPEASVVAVFRDYAGDPFESLVKPRVAEALNELTALRSAEMIVQKREEVKSKALEGARRKLGDVLMIEDLVLENINLTSALENAIEAKMVQEQEAARARFAQQQVQVEASTVVIKAKGEAESMVLRGKALRENPSVLELQIIERWDGITPLVVGPGVTGANMMLPLGDFTTGASPVTKEGSK
ncbi:prohibitin family protein [Horticoccus sp. 23ND18S-11]|uniref:prohibitin family protein n=1 Tax=Horticoccus sp. 23ND18S-11 TaxID=3391832 RepID=UPI0039C9E918